MLTALAAWSARRRLAAAAAAVATLAIIGLPTALIPNPIFGREIPPTWWAWPTLLVTAALSGLLLATYLRDPAISDLGEPSDSGDPGTTRRSGTVGGLLAYLAVGCPVCNKLALLALGYSGAVAWFAPIQPYLGVAGIGLLAWSLRARLRGQLACPVPTP